MKTLLSGILFTIILGMSVGTSASEEKNKTEFEKKEPVQLVYNQTYWACLSESRHAWGESRGYAYKYDAETRSLRECAARTPSYDTCYVIKCWKHH